MTSNEGSRWQMSRLAMRQPITLLAIVLVAGALFSDWKTAMTASGVDFYNYWVVTRAVLRGRIENIYSPAGRVQLCHDFVGREIIEPKTHHRLFASRPGASLREKAAAEVSFFSNRAYLGYEGLQTVNTPFLFSVFQAFTTGGYEGDYETDYRFFVGFSLACYAISVLVLCRLLRYSAAASPACWPS